MEIKGRCLSIMVLGHLQRAQLNVQNAAPTHVSAMPAFTAWEPAPSPLQGFGRCLVAPAGMPAPAWREAKGGFKGGRDSGTGISAQEMPLCAERKECPVPGSQGHSSAL